MSETTTTDPDTEDPTPDSVEDPDPTPTSQPVALSGTTEGATTMANPTPTPDTELGFSYEHGVDVFIPPVAPATEGTWQHVRFASAINPSVTPKEVDAATYDDLGADHPIKTGETPQLDFYVQQHRLSTGKFLPEVEALLAATRPDALGNKATIKVRYYDKPVEGTPNPDEAYELTATVSAFARAATDNSSIGGWNFTLKGQGPRRKITNPAAA